jgi:hypothetical protein
MDRSECTIAGVRMGFLLLFASAAGLWAQPLQVFSEFARIDAQGKVLAPEFPREILSPALVRNGFTSFQVLVSAPPAASWRFYVAQNPEDAVRVTLYRENGELLEPVTQPAAGTGTQIFWLDLWTNPSSPVQRIKVEPQLNVNGDWVIYPMEGRIVSARVPVGERPPGTAQPTEVMRGFLCGVKVEEGPPAAGVTQASLRFRNAHQDRALAASVSREELQKRFGACDAPPADNPEWYFRIRDFLFGARQ